MKYPAVEAGPTLLKTGCVKLSAADFDTVTCL